MSYSRTFINGMLSAVLKRVTITINIVAVKVRYLEFLAIVNKVNVI